jgi:hypothetical protein
MHSSEREVYAGNSMADSTLLESWVQGVVPVPIYKG